MRENSDRETVNEFSGIAIIGMSGRFPGAHNIDQFWQNLREGKETIKFFSEEKLKISEVDFEAVKHDPNYVRARGVLENIEYFDAKFFGFSPKEARILDPQQRIWLESAWEALENAGYDPERYEGLIGIFSGGSFLDSYLLHNLCRDREYIEAVVRMRNMDTFSCILNNSMSFMPTRTSYKFNLKGPSVNVQTACSTSLVAVCLACQSLANYDSDICLAGGVSIVVPQEIGYYYEEGGIPSPDGHCRPFDAAARGTVSGNGVGVVALKRLEDAVADRDTILAIIKGWAINNDGRPKVSYTAPSVDGQAEVIAMAQAVAGINPETITYIEAHGTATPLGDPVEVAGLTKAFRAKTDASQFCGIGSVKGNIGHLDAAAGVAGLIKAVLALQHKEIPPSLHYKNPNPEIDFVNSPFYVVSELTEWEKTKIPRRAGVSSFGIGGTNAHVVLEEAPNPGVSEESRQWQLITISAKTGLALDSRSKLLVEYLKTNPGKNITDVAFTLNVGRQSMNHRRFLVCRDHADAIKALESSDPKRVFTREAVESHPGLGFMFPEQGSQYVNMGLELYRTESIFREQVDRCCGILGPHLGFDLRDILYPDEKDVERAAEKLRQTYITQPALFTIEYALAKLWMSWGVQPEAMVGHSIGEYVAACLAGIFSLEDAIYLVSTRGQLMQSLPAGAMLAVLLSEEEVQLLLNSKLSLSAVNGPSFCVISGEKEDIEDLERELSKRNVDFRRLHTSHAFHSKMMDPILEAFGERVSQVKLGPPQIPFVSNLTGTWRVYASYYLLNLAKIGIIVICS